MTINTYLSRISFFYQGNFFKLLVFAKGQIRRVHLRDTHCTIQVQQGPWNTRARLYIH